MTIATRFEDDDTLHEECGVFGIWKVPSAAAVTALGLHALQHRGQEATGIVSFDGARFHSHRGLGRVELARGEEDLLRELRSDHVEQAADPRQAVAEAELRRGHGETRRANRLWSPASADIRSRPGR